MEKCNHQGEIEQIVSPWREKVECLDAEVEHLRDALHRISLAAQNSASTMRSIGQEAREALDRYKKETATDDLFRIYNDPMLPKQEQVVGYKQDRIDPDFLADTSDDELCNEMATARHNLERYCFKTGSMLDHWRGDNRILELLIHIARKRFQHYQDLLAVKTEDKI